MNANTAREEADKFYQSSKSEDYLEDRVLNGIFMDITEQSNQGEYSLEYDKTAGLNKKDLRYCKGKLEEFDYQVDADYKNGILNINW